MGGLWDFLGQQFGWIWEGLSRLVSSIGDIFASAFSKLTEWLGALLKPFLDLVGGLFYLITNLVDVMILVLQVFMLLVQVLFAVIGGVMRTFVALTAWDPASVVPDHNPYAEGTNLLLSWWHQLGGDVVPQVLAWVLWLWLAYALLRLFAGSSGQSAGGE